ncbi:MAG: family 16 glycoside hydrolase [Polyangiales bacterium]
MRIPTSLPLLLLAASCHGKSATPVPSERGHDPWVLRSTVDERPRMISLALRPDLWATYDAERGALYRVSPQGLNLDGAVYNTHHGPQPISRGHASLLSAYEEPWHVLRNGSEHKPSVRYRGHRFEGGHVVLRYTLTLDGQSTEVEEQPEAFLTNDGRLGLERTFRVQGPAQVVLDFNAPELASTDDVRLLTRDEGNLTGKLTLRNDAASTLRIVFPPAKQTKAARAPDQPRGQALIADSDCFTCHNPTARAVGPSWAEIAARYFTTPQTITGLANKIRLGGADQWGETAMISHPQLEQADAEEIARFILTKYDPEDREGEQKSHPLSGEGNAPPDFDASKLIPGVTVEVFEIGHPLASMPRLPAEQKPNVAFVSESTALADLRRDEPSTGAIVRMRGWLLVEEDGEHDFRIEHDGVIELNIDEVSLLRDGDRFDASERHQSPWVSADWTKGLHPFDVTYVSRGEAPVLTLRWQTPSGKLEPVPLAQLRTFPAPETEPGLKTYTLDPGTAGDARPLDRVHPSFALGTVRPHRFKPMVGGIDFLPDGTPVISTWDGRGSVYTLHGAGGDPEQIELRPIAEGLSEPLGLKVVDGEIYVLQKHELTRLVDRDHDGVTDDYQTVSNGWGATGNFHEFAFGLAYQHEHFYATLATAIAPGGVAATGQNKDRGKVMKIARADGALAFVGRGLRTPNGIGVGPDDALFVTDNEGDWLPANKLLLVQPGAFYGSRAVDPDAVKDLPVTPPVAWMPRDEIANSPSQPFRIDLGPYQNQLLYGDVTYGGLARVMLQKVKDTYQGCVVPFTQGLESGINRAAVAPDGAIWVGGIGNPGDWAQDGKLWYGLQRLTYTGAPVFELRDVALRADGIALDFSEPLQHGDGERAEDYLVEQWRYVATVEYGGSKIDPREVGVESVHVSEDRRHVFLATAPLAEGHVVHVRVRNSPVSSAGRELWSNESWCTLNTQPAQPGTRRPTATAHNTLTPEERATGWQLLFDGKSTRGLRMGRGWQVRDGVLHALPGRGEDLRSERSHGDFELAFEWKTQAGGNGGVFYRADPRARELWHSALELQLLDDEAHEDGKLPLRRAGAAYDLFAPALAITRPVGEWNRARIVVRGSQVEHWLNGHQVVAFDTASETYARQRAASKFATLPEPPLQGLLGLQHHGEAVAFRNLKLRALPH